jgi:hypothetical protein
VADAASRSGLYVFLQMPQNTFLAVVIVNASSVLYPHYATLERAWGPTPLEDQQLAGAIMWVGGDLAFLIAVMAIIVGWVRAEERDARRSDRRADSERVAIQVRERRLAERLARERGDVSGAKGPSPGPVSGAGLARDRCGQVGSIVVRIDVAAAHDRDDRSFGLA